MAEDKSKRGEPGEEAERPGAGGFEPAGSGASDEEGVAYESDWYRSLKLLAERRAEEAGEDEEEETSEGEAGTVAAEVEQAPAAAKEAVSAEAAASAEVAAEQPPAETQEHRTVVLGEPEPAEVADGGVPEPASLAGPTLSSTDAADRRAALTELLRAGASGADVREVSALIGDPDPDVRKLALEVLLARAADVEPTSVRQALQDPNDEVRAAAVGLAVVRGGEHLSDLVPLVGARRWPLTQRAAMESLPALVRAHDLDEDQLASLLSSVAGMDPAPDEMERAGLAEVAQTIGVGRIAPSLSTPDERRLGAVRLLRDLEEPAAYRALADLSNDPLEEIRGVVATAAGLVAGMERAETEAQASPTVQVAHAADGHLITGLAKTLDDPDVAVRDRAVAALNEIAPTDLLAWVRESLRDGDIETAALAARVAESRRLAEAAPEVLARGVDTPHDGREPYTKALAAFDMDLEVLSRTLGEVDAARRPEAMRLMWRVVGRAMLPYLRDVASDPSGTVRVEVLELLGESGDPSATELAKRALETDTSPAVRTTAIRVIGHSGAELQLSSLEQALADPDPAVRMTALDILPEALGGRATEPLLRAMNDLDDGVWRSAARQIAGFAEREPDLVWSALRGALPDRRDALLEELERVGSERLAQIAAEHVRSPDYSERALAVELAGRASGQAGVDAAVGALQDPIAPVRRAAAEALARLRSPSSVAALGRSLDVDPDPEVRIGVLRALGVIDDEGALGFLVIGLRDSEIAVREAASEVLTKWSSPAVARRLAQVLEHPNHRAAAADLLRKIGPAAVELLTDVAIHGRPEIAPVVGELLTEVAGLESFVERLSSIDPEQRRRAVVAIGAIGGREAVDALTRALADPNEHVRTAAIRHLGELGDTRAIEAIQRCSQADPVPDVAAAAQEVLARLGA